MLKNLKKLSQDKQITQGKQIPFNQKKSETIEAEFEYEIEEVNLQYQTDNQFYKTGIKFQNNNSNNNAYSQQNQKENSQNLYGKQQQHFEFSESVDFDDSSKNKSDFNSLQINVNQFKEQQSGYEQNINIKNNIQSSQNQIQSESNQSEIISDKMSHKQKSALRQDSHQDDQQSEQDQVYMDQQIEEYINQLQQQVEYYKSAFEDLELQNKQLIDQNLNLLEENKQLKSNQYQQQEIITDDKLIDVYKTENENQQKIIKDLKESLLKEKEKNQNIIQINQTTQQIEEQKARLILLEQENLNLKKDLNLQLSKINELKQSFIEKDQQQQDNIVKITIQNQQLVLQNEQLNKQIEANKIQIKQLKQQLQSINLKQNEKTQKVEKAEQDNVIKILSSIKNDLNQLKQKNTDKDKFNQIEAIISKVEQNVNHIPDLNEQLQQTKEKHLDIIHKQQEMILNQQKQIKHLQKTIYKLSKNIKTKDYIMFEEQINQLNEKIIKNKQMQCEECIKTQNQQTILNQQINLYQDQIQRLVQKFKQFKQQKEN